MKNQMPYGFRLVRFITLEFALIDQNFSNESEEEIVNNFEYGVLPEDKTIVVATRFQFVMKDQPFIIINLAGQFQLSDDTWEALEKDQPDKVLVPRELLTHLTMLVVGAARGALHAKLEATAFNQFVIPTINLQEQITEDTYLPLVDPRMDESDG